MNRREVIQQLHNKLKGHELGQGTGVRLYDFSVEESKDKHPVDGPPPQLFVLQLVVTEPNVTEETIQDAMAAYYDIMKDSCLLDTVKISSIMFTGGMQGMSYGGINILDPSLNLMPAYIRHYYVLPTPILSIPSKISNSIYTLNTAAVDHLKKFFKAADVQTAVITRAELRMKQFMKGTIKHNSTAGDEIITVHYSLPEDTHLEYKFDANNHYKITPTLVFDGNQIKFSIPDQERETFLAKNYSNMDELITLFGRQVYHALYKLMKKYGLETRYTTDVNSENIGAKMFQ